MSSSSRSKQAIDACGGNMQKVLEQLDNLQRTTEYDSESLSALKRYCAASVIKKNSPDVYQCSEPFFKMMLSTAMLYQQMGQKSQVDTIWKTMIKYRVGKNIAQMYIEKANWDHSRGNTKAAIAGLKNADLLPSDVQGKEMIAKQLQFFLESREFNAGTDHNPGQVQQQVHNDAPSSSKNYAYGGTSSHEANKFGPASSSASTNFNPATAAEKQKHQDIAQTPKSMQNGTPMTGLTNVLNQGLAKSVEPGGHVMQSKLLNMNDSADRNVFGSARRTIDKSLAQFGGQNLRSAQRMLPTTTVGASARDRSLDRSQELFGPSGGGGSASSAGMTLHHKGSSSSASTGNNLQQVLAPNNRSNSNERSSMQTGSSSVLRSNSGERSLSGGRSMNIPSFNLGGGSGNAAGGTVVSSTSNGGSHVLRNGQQQPASSSSLSQVPPDSAHMMQQGGLSPRVRGGFNPSSSSSSNNFLGGGGNNAIHNNPGSGSKQPASQIRPPSPSGSLFGGDQPGSGSKNGTHKPPPGYQSPVKPSAAKKSVSFLGPPLRGALRTIDQHNSGEQEQEERKRQYELEERKRLEQEELMRRQSVSMMLCDSTANSHNLSPILEEENRSSSGSNKNKENENDQKLKHKHHHSNSDSLFGPGGSTGGNESLDHVPSPQRNKSPASRTANSNQSHHGHQNQQLSSGGAQQQQNQSQSQHQSNGQGRMNASVSSSAAKPKSLISSASDEQTEPSDNIKIVDGHKVLYVNDTAYRKIGVVGRGGSSKVFKVVDPKTNKTLALKRVLTSNPTQFLLFKNEVNLLEKLKGKPNIIQIVDSEIIKQEKLLVLMEYGDSDFSRFLQSEPDLDYPDIKRFWRQMLEAVQVVHDERIVHSDLKPANFLLVRNQLQLIDFGIAKAIPNNDTTNIQRDHQIGTLSYMAPEAVCQAHTGPVKLGRSSDIWSLGIILYQMVYKRTPFSHLNPMQRILTISDPRTVIDFPECPRLAHDPDTWEKLQDSIRRCLERESMDRATLPELLAHPFLERKSLPDLQKSSFQTVFGEKFLKLMHEQMLKELAGENMIPSTTTEESSETAAAAVCDAVWAELSEATSSNAASASTSSSSSSSSSKPGSTSTADATRGAVIRWVRSLKLSDQLSQQHISERSASSTLSSSSRGLLGGAASSTSSSSLFAVDGNINSTDTAKRRRIGELGVVGGLSSETGSGSQQAGFGDMLQTNASNQAGSMAAPAAPPPSMRPPAIPPEGRSFSRFQPARSNNAMAARLQQRYNSLNQGAGGFG
ncbi:unnamed protein product [Amoebophrya sp. A120]|nr:unnamed protein product [Amoebophrya sp. A120]|eukprot:GSA120T00026133001.1